ncbi:hypothetical protein ACFL2A_07165 [Thermodesulfobacteriota bacterium]
MKVPASKFQIKLGGDIFIDVGCILAYKDEPIFTLKRGENGQLLIYFSIYGKTGDKIATIKGNRAYLNNSNTNISQTYEIKHEQDRVRIIESDTGKTICDIKKGMLVDNKASVPIGPPREVIERFKQLTGREIPIASKEIEIELEVNLETYLHDGFSFKASPEAIVLDGKSMFSSNIHNASGIGFNLSRTLPAEDILAKMNWS